MKRSHLAILAAAVLLFAAACKKEDTRPTLQEKLSSEARYSTFVRALQLTDFWKSLDGSLYYTFLVPPNEAFNTWLSETGYGSIDSVPLPLLTQIVLYHSQIGLMYYENLRVDYILTPAPGPGNAPIAYLVEQVNGAFRFNGSATLSEVDIDCRDGVLHVITEVLVPPTIMELLEQNAEFSTLVRAVDIAGLRDTLEQAGPWTLFAPPNGVFSNFFENHPNYFSLNDMPQREVRNLLLYHLLPRQLRYEDVQNNFAAESYPTLLSGRSLRIANQSGIVINETISPLLMNVQATNGPVHIIDEVLQ